MRAGGGAGRRRLDSHPGRFRLDLQIANPGTPYGATGRIVALLTFLYLAGIVVVTGAVVNAVTDHRYDRRTMGDLARRQAGGVPDPAEPTQSSPVAKTGGHSRWRDLLTGIGLGLLAGVVVMRRFRY